MMVSEYQMRRYCVVVVVGTCNRSRLLHTRSMPSIAAQTYAPQLVVVVDDSTTECQRHRTKVVLHEYNSANAPNAIYLQNCRTKGASGAWNTGITLIVKLQECSNIFFHESASL